VISLEFFVLGFFVRGERNLWEEDREVAKDARSIVETTESFQLTLSRMLHEKSPAGEDWYRKKRL